MSSAPTKTPPTKYPDDKAALFVAREVARWHLGSPDWADMIIDAYLNPERARQALSDDKAGV